MAQEVLGVDIGGVLWGQTYREFFWQPLPGAFEALRQLSKTRFKNRIFLVSHVRFLGESATSLWLACQRFHTKTGIGKDKVFFCRQRRQKAGICQRLGVTHFIDDRAEIMEYLHDAGIPNLYLFQPRPKELKNHQQVLANVRQVASWYELGLRLLCSSC